MSGKDGVFVTGEVDYTSREPVTSFQGHGINHDSSVRVAVDGARHRRRRPRKVVVYYFDSDDAEESGLEEGDGARLAAGEACEDGSGAKMNVAHRVNTTTSNDMRKLDCPLFDEMEEYSSGNNSNQCDRVPSPSRGNACRCHCTCQDMKSSVSVENPRIGSPTPIGFFAFGMTTLIYNVHNARICKLNMVTMGLVITFGGLTQFLCGFFELINMNTFGCTISTTYGAFWVATAVSFLVPENDYVTMSDPSYMGGFFLMWFFFAGTLFVSSFRSPFLCMTLFFLVPLNFLLQAIGYFLDSGAVARVAGYEGIIVGVLATYLGMAFTIRDVYGRSLLPILFQKNLRYVECEVDVTSALGESLEPPPREVSKLNSITNPRDTQRSTIDAIFVAARSKQHHQRPNSGNNKN